MATGADQITVRHLLLTEHLAGHVSVGTERALDRVIRMVATVSSVGELGDLPPDTLAILSRSALRMEDVTADIAIRRAVTGNLAGLVAELPPSGLPIVTRRLAEKLQLAVVLVTHVDATSLAGRLEPVIRAPILAAVDGLQVTVERMLRLPAGPQDVVRDLREALGLQVAIVRADGGQVAGELPVAGWELAAGLEPVAARNGACEPQVFALREGDIGVAVPAVRLAEAPANLWLVAILAARDAALLDVARSALVAAALSFSLYLADQALRAERDAQYRGSVLREILEQGDSATRPCVEAATGLGWRLFGWHNAVQVGLAGPAAAAPAGTLSTVLETQLRNNGLEVAVVGRAAGPAFWLTARRPPSEADIAQTVRVIRRVLLSLERDVPGLAAYAGIGGAHPGIAGIATSMQESQQAFVLARSRDVHAAVEVMDARAAQRIVLGWYPSGPLRESAMSLVEPLSRDDASGELCRTLRCYLDYESSITSTAAILGLHRNTVIHRLRRIRRLLPVDLDQPEERLAVHLALRLVEGTPDPE